MLAALHLQAAASTMAVVMILRLSERACARSTTMLETTRKQQEINNDCIQAHRIFLIYHTKVC